ncbi:MAG: 1-acyl-sn-glycerol-3-phosphate acyltransferase [Phycisphaeraceae bacterium]|nr:1-acyl-sn-glycerol-3-phosphate acyltransferase [Phycisphaeraceae bacterium]
MGSLFYRSCRLCSRFIAWQTLREVVLDSDRADRKGGFIIACTHLSHLEPILVSATIERHIRWMARIEFYRPWWGAAALNLGGAFPVDRYGCSLPAVRTAVRLAQSGECVGIFPEGGVAKGRQSMLRGAPFKHGVCTVAVASRTPILPVIVLGTDRLNQVSPWLPFRRGRLWYAFGHDVAPPPRSASRRADRAEMASRLGAEFIRLYHDLLARTGLTDGDIP